MNGGRDVRRPAARAAHAPPDVPGDAAVVVVGSGKGGTGKSTTAVRLAVALARLGRRALLCDGVQAHGNLHVLLGERPAPLERVLDGTIRADHLLRRLDRRLWLLPAAAASERLAALEPTDRARLHLRLSALFARFDVTLVDAGSDVDGVLRAMTVQPARLLLVTLPEPAALADAFALAKITLGRCPSAPIDVVVNRAGAALGERAFARLDEATQRFLDRPLGRLGTLPDDPRVGRASRRARELLALDDAAIHGLARDLAARFETAGAEAEEAQA